MRHKPPDNHRETKGPAVIGRNRRPQQNNANGILARTLNQHNCTIPDSDCQPLGASYGSYCLNYYQTTVDNLPPHYSLSQFKTQYTGPVGDLVDQARRRIASAQNRRDYVSAWRHWLILRKLVRLAEVGQ